jgi:site-specific DNA-methyltransferase (adenine-specific)/modification methylase
VWEKSKATNFLNAKKQPLRKYEEVAIFYKKPPTYNPQFTYGEAYNKGTRKDQLTGSYGEFSPVEVKSDGIRYPTDILYFKTAESEGQVYHPTQKPIAMCEYFIKTYTNEGDTVLDNCMGVGTSGIAANKLNRNFIGIELDDKYFSIAEKRIEGV